MATTQDSIIAGYQPPFPFLKAATATPVAFRPMTLWGLNGTTGAGVYNGTLNGVALDSTTAQLAGQIPFVDVAPSTYNYLANITLAMNVHGQIIFADRLWHNGGITITSTSAQAITSPTFPARDANGSTNGEGVLLAVEVSAITGAGTPTITISYTNSDGTAGRTATNVQATTAASVVGSTYLMSLQAGDTGVRSVQSITLSATWTSGTINIVAYRPIVSVVGIANTPGIFDPLTGGFSKMYNGSVPFLIIVNPAATAITSFFNFQYSQVA